MLCVSYQFFWKAAGVFPGVIIHRRDRSVARKAKCYSVSAFFGDCARTLTRRRFLELDPTPNRASKLRTVTSKQALEVSGANHISLTEVSYLSPVYFLTSADHRATSKALGIL